MSCISFRFVPGSGSPSAKSNMAQAELARSKETGNELQNLASSLTDIQDTLGGGFVSTRGN